MSGQSSAEGCGPAALALIGDPERPPLPFKAVVVVAHPDDETIGCGSLLARFADVRIVHTTDGAPRRNTSPGFRDWQDYRAARAGELRAAVALAGIGEDRLACLGIPDQDAMLHLSEISDALQGLIAGADLVLTHAYEGGHPDHDATAFAAHAACARLGAAAPAVLEMPLYHAGRDGGWVVQRFAPTPRRRGLAVPLSVAEQALKQAMFATYTSQSAVLGMFQLEAEYFRVAPCYRFDALPNGGRLLYEGFGWGITGERWLALVRAALGPPGRP